MTATAWRRVTGELLLIVVGVLCAITLESWWSDRTEARIQRAELAGITEEFDAAAAVLGGLIIQHRDNVARLTVLRSLLASGRPDLPRDSIAVLSQSLWHNQSYSASTPIYSGFAESGRLAKLGASVLSRAFFEYEAALRDNEVWDLYLSQSMVQAWEPVLATRIPLGLSSSELPAVISRMQSPAELARDLTFTNLVAARLETEQYMISRRELLAEATKAVVGTIEAETPR